MSDGNLSDRGNIEDLNRRLQQLLNEFRNYFVAWVADGATATNQVTMIAHLASLDAELESLRTDFNAEDFASETTLAAIKAVTDQLAFYSDQLKTRTTLPDVYFSAFNRLRTDLTANRFDCEFIYNKQEEVIDEVLVSGGTATHNTTSRDITLDINNTTTGTEASLYSYDIPYTPGNSQLIAITGVINEADLAGDTEIFFRTNVSGSVVETVYAQADWEYEGVNTSAITTDVDWSFSQILEIDFQSLKVGRIRFYLNRNGALTPIHEIFNDNLRSDGYWQLPSLPLAWRIYNDATYTYMELCYGDEENAIGLRHKVTKNATAQMRAICGTVKSEGGAPLEEIPGFHRGIDMGTTSKTVATTLIPLISIRPRALYNSLNNRSLVVPESFSVSVDNPIRLVIIHDCALTNASWVNVDTNESVVEYDVSATAITNGHIVDSEYLSTSKNAASGAKSLLGRTLLWNRRGAETGILTIAAERTTNTSSTTLASMNWKEIR